jgi:hypothetical protein
MHKMRQQLVQLRTEAEEVRKAQKQVDEEKELIRSLLQESMTLNSSKQKLQRDTAQLLLDRKKIEAAVGQ